MPAYHKAEIHAERRRLRIVVRIKRDAHQIGCASQHQCQQKNQTARIGNLDQTAPPTIDC